MVGLSCACAPPPEAPPSGVTDASRVVPALATAFAEEAEGSPPRAIRSYLDVLDAATAARPDGWQLAITAATLDALVFRGVDSLGSVSPDTALVYRTEDPSLTRSDSLGGEERRRAGARPEDRATESIATRLATAYSEATGPFMRGMIAEAMTRIAEHRGDVDDASRWREWSGCAREATVVGPLDWAPLTGVARPDPLAAYDAKIAVSYPGPGAFGVASPPVLVRGRGCSIELSAASSNAGVRDVVVDVVVPRSQRIGVMMRAGGTATLRAGGKLVIDRPYELGGGEVSRFAWVDVPPPAGTVRLVARVGMDQEGESVRLAAWDDAGRPLRLRAPRPMEAATVQVVAAEPIAYPTPRNAGEELAIGLAALANQDPRTAEYVLEHDAAGKDAPPDLALAYARAVEQARDLALVHRADRARNAYERVLAVWPRAWEAIIAHAWLAGQKRGPGDARFAELEDLETLRARARAAPQGAGAGQLDEGVLDVFELAASAREHLWDRVQAVDTRLQASLGRSSILADVERIAQERSASELADYDCAAHPGKPRPRGTLACYASLRGKGDLHAALAELERVRSVRGGVDLYLPLTVRDGLALGLSGEVDRALRDMLPAEVTLSSAYGAASLDPSRGTPAYETREKLLAIAGVAHDAPVAIAPLSRALRDDPTATFAGVAEAVVHEDRAHPVLPAAATAVLRHSERYDVARTGVVHAIVFDLRRVGGTTDVEENAQAGAPGLTGRTSLRILRRRILKHDGTVVEPDPNPGASQGHADLAQLEAGDVVEAIYEGWSVPLETGDIGIDTVDLLPPRVAVHEATVEIHVPSDLKYSLWSHPILGAARREAMGNETVLRWSLGDHLARRVEDATPKMDRSVGVSLSTATWAEVGRGLREAVAARTDHDPAVLAWARQAVADAHAGTDTQKVVAVVVAAGAAVKEGDPGDLSDLLYGHSMGPQSTTARGILADHEGSRTWLIVRALRELGIACEVVVAENEPWSASLDFPPHLGRFVHPLAIAHVKPDAPAPGGQPTAVDLAIDADVSGPPLPAGHISPELRGRQALHEDGTIAPLPETSGVDERDEIDERLTLDARGDARGTFTIILRGREAQDIAEALEKNVGDQRMRSLRGIVLAWVPFANVDSVELSSTEGSWQVALRAEIGIPGYAQAVGKGSAAGTTWILPGLEPIHDVYPRGSSATLSATYASEGTRESALAISRAVQYHAHRRVELPPGASIVRLPGPFDVQTRALSASRKLRVSGLPQDGSAGARAPGAATVVEDDVSLSVPTGTVPPAAYAAFVADAHRTDDACLATTRIRTGPPEKRPAPRPAP
jgi:hypothetical protein